MAVPKDIFQKSKSLGLTGLGLTSTTAAPKFRSAIDRIDDEQIASLGTLNMNEDWVQPEQRILTFQGVVAPVTTDDELNALVQAMSLKDKPSMDTSDLEDTKTAKEKKQSQEESKLKQDTKLSSEQRNRKLLDKIPPQVLSHWRTKEGAIELQCYIEFADIRMSASEVRQNSRYSKNIQNDKSLFIQIRDALKVTLVPVTSGGDSYSSAKTTSVDPFGILGTSGKLAYWSKEAETYIKTTKAGLLAASAPAPAPKAASQAVATTPLLFNKTPLDSDLDETMPMSFPLLDETLYDDDLDVAMSLSLETATKASSAASSTPKAEKKR